MPCIHEVKTPLRELGGQRGDIFVVKLKQLRQVGHYMESNIQFPKVIMM